MLTFHNLVKEDSVEADGVQNCRERKKERKLGRRKGLVVLGLHVCLRGAVVLVLRCA